MEMKARYLAYRSFRLEDMTASHAAAWAHACANWESYLTEIPEEPADVPAPVVLPAAQQAACPA
jgi:hypothetical protein